MKESANSNSRTRSCTQNSSCCIPSVKPGPVASGLTPRIAGSADSMKSMRFPTCESTMQRMLARMPSPSQPAPQTPAASSSPLLQLASAAHRPPQRQNSRKQSSQETKPSPASCKSVDAVSRAMPPAPKTMMAATSA